MRRSRASISRCAGERSSLSSARTARVRPQCGTGFLADPGFRHQAAQATGRPEAALEAAAVADPHTTVRADVERLLTAPSLSPKVSVSGHVYDIAAGRLTAVLDARHPQPAGNN